MKGCQERDEGESWLSQTWTPIYNLAKVSCAYGEEISIRQLLLEPSKNFGENECRSLLKL